MPENDRQVTVSAAANVALIKYWGKTSAPGNQPATASLSIGLNDLRTTTSLSGINDDTHDIVADLDEAACSRLRAYLDDVCELYSIPHRFRVETRNNFPTGAGLASSASGFAALALAINALADLQLSDTELSRLARRGSGSAARSVFDGFVEIIPTDDAYAQQIMPADAWPLHAIVAVTDSGTKPIGSTEAMQRSAATSPFYAGWLDSHASDLEIAKAALAARDFEKLADVAEHNCLKMHATIMTSQPPILYWQPATIAIMHRVRELRAAGTPVFFTIDAGAQVKVICLPEYKEAAADALDLPGVTRIISTPVGSEPVIDTR